MAQVVSSSTVARTGQWGHGLFGCFDNIEICIIAYFVPCVTFGQTSEGLGKDCCLYGFAYLFFPCNWVLEARQRGQIRDMRGIPGSGAGDCCTICWCSFCTLIQEAQEIKDMREGTDVTFITTTTVTTAGGNSSAQQVAAPGGGYTGPAGYVQYVPPASADQKMTRQ